MGGVGVLSVFAMRLLKDIGVSALLEWVHYQWEWVRSGWEWASAPSFSGWVTLGVY